MYKRVHGKLGKLIKGKFWAKKSKISDMDDVYPYIKARHPEIKDVENRTTLWMSRGRFFTRIKYVISLDQ